MFYRKDAVFVAVASLLASCGFAMADTTGLQTPAPSPDPTVVQPTVVQMDDAAPLAPLMMALDKIGAAKPLSDAGINIYGWVEAGYTYNHRHASDNTPILPGPFNTEPGNHFMLNQVDLRFERQIADPKKFDVGGMIEFLYGTDANLTHSTGINFYGVDPSTSNTAFAAAERESANYGLDLLQAYIDVNLPLGSGLKIRVGKFVTLLSTETIDPRGNAFYSHSYSFNALPFTQTGVLAFYTLNEQWAFIGGITRGWDQSLEDSGPEGGTCAIDGTGQITYTPNKQITANFTWNVGPEDFGDTSHYRTVIDPTVSWQVTDAFKVGGEILYIYDGGLNGDAFSDPRVTHAYGDVWAGDLYLAYMFNDYVTANGRFEKYHTSAEGTLGAVSAPPGGSLNVYSITLGVTVTPLPKDPIGENLSIRPEIRYDFSDSSAHPPFEANGQPFKDQLTFAADVIFKF